MLCCAFATLIFALTFYCAQSMASDHGKVRMYKMSKKGQLFKQRWLSNVSGEGCHGTLKKRNVHRFAQVGFDYCQVFSKPNCEPESALSVIWKGKQYRQAELETVQLKILRGTQWYLHPYKNVDVRSWSCFY